MKKMNFLLAATAIYSAFLSDSCANTRYSDVSTENIPTINETKRYNTEDGGYYNVSVRSFCGSTECGFTTNYVKYDSNGQRIASGGKDYNYGLNGSPAAVGWGRTVLDFDENGNFLGEMNGSEGQNNIARTSRINSSSYTDSGKILSYDTTNNLIGAYNNLIDYIAQRMISTSNLNLDLRDSNGNYYERDSHGNITDAYYQNGGKSPHISYKYDGAGNITEKYENGKLIYAKKIYTPAEAAAAVHDGNDNVVSITW